VATAAEMTIFRLYGESKMFGSRRPGSFHRATESLRRYYGCVDKL